MAKQYLSSCYTTAPVHFNFSTLGVLAANGSSAAGAGSNVQLNSDNTRISTCLTPTSSVLFDGVIPTLTALDENMWASQLMILHRPEFGYNDFRITTDFGDGPVNIRRVEVTIFNCPQWGTAVEYIRVDYVATVYTTVFSCDSLLKVCIQVNTSSPQLRLYFDRYSNQHQVHIAELSFYQSSSPCPLFTMIPGNWSPPAIQHQGYYYSYQ